MESFIDTNILIAYTFHIDSLHLKAKEVFNEYQTIVYSKRVKLESDFIFSKKRNILQKFFEDLMMEITYENSNWSSLKNLKKLLSKKDLSEDDKRQIKSSLDSFWAKYVNEQFPSNETMHYAIFGCLDDLDICSFLRKSKIEKQIKITEKRIKPYNRINRKLNRIGVHVPDDEIVLDAHDYNLKNNDKLDFITFDSNFYNGINQIKEFSFNKIKCKDDFYTRFN